jgi:hypothetical protein
MSLENSEMTASYSIRVGVGGAEANQLSRAECNRRELRDRGPIRLRRLGPPTDARDFKKRVDASLGKTEIGPTRSPPPNKEGTRK